MADSVTLISSGFVQLGMEEQLAAWQARQTEALSRQRGFLSTELILPRSGAKDRRWKILVTFQSQETFKAWQASEACQALCAEATSFWQGQDYRESLHREGEECESRVSVTEVIFSKVRSGMADQFRNWAQRIQAAQALYPGYLGMYLQPPPAGGDGHWITILRYESPACLEAWMTSRQRADLLKESKSFMEGEELIRISTSYPGWVPVDPVSGQGPPDWKTAMLVLLGLYPIVMLELKLLNPILFALQIHDAVGTFLGNAISVAVTSFLTMRFFVRKFDWWLFSGLASPRGMSRQGIRMILLLYLLEVVIFWKLFSP